MQVWSQAVAKVGSTDPKKVMEAIKAGAWDTVIGKLEFDAKGDIKQIDYVVYKWDAKGNYTEIDPGKEMCLDQALEVLLWLYGTQEKSVMPRLSMVDRCDQALRIFLVYPRQGCDGLIGHADPLLRDLENLDDLTFGSLGDGRNQIRLPRYGREEARHAALPVQYEIGELNGDEVVDRINVGNAFRFDGKRSRPMRCRQDGWSVERNKQTAPGAELMGVVEDAACIESLIERRQRGIICP